MGGPKQIFLPYCWANDEVVKKIDDVFQVTGITLIKDIRDLKNYESIKDYMQRFRKTDFILLIISDAYLKSRNCMYEILELIKDENYKNKILPIILDDADILREKGKLKRVKYWKEKRDTLEAEAKGLDLESVSETAKELRVLKNITNNVTEFLTTITDMLCVSLKDLQETGYKVILEKIGHEDAKLLKELFKITEIKDKEDQDIAIDDFLFNHLKYAQAYFFKAKIEEKRLQFKKTIKYYERAIELKPDFAAAHNNLGLVWNDKNKHNKAIECFEKALEIDLKIFGQEHPDIARDYNNLGGAWYVKDEYTQAIEYFEKALEIGLRVFNKEHPYVAAIYNNLGSTWKAKDEYGKAIEYFEKALTIFQKLLPPNHLNIKTVEENLESAKKAK